MKKDFRSRIAGLMVSLMAVSSVGNTAAIPAVAATTDDGIWEYEIYAKQNDITYIKLIGYNGMSGDVVIPNHIGDNERDNIVISIENQDIFDGHDEIETLTFGKYLTGFNTRIFDPLENVSEYRVADGNSKLSADDGVLYMEDSLIAYPKAKSGNYTIKDGTTSIGHRSFLETEIDTLTIPSTVNINNEVNNTDNRYDYSFLGAKIKNYEYGDNNNGSIIINGRLVAYGSDSATDLSNVTSANPYAFQTEEQLLDSNLPDDVRKTVPFSFYSGEINNLQTRYFNINGKTAYCYNHGKLNPVTVKDLSDYDEAVSTQEVRHEVKAILFAGYPNDAYGLLDLTGVDEEAAKNITGSLVWKAVDNIQFDLDSIYGIEDKNAAADYADAMMNKIKEISDSEMEDFELKFYSPIGDVQGLVVINKVSRPVQEKPSISITKKDITTNKELPGAKLIVTKEGVTVDTWISTESAHVIYDLEDGTYVLTEETAPDGYLIAESIRFNVENGKVSQKEIVMYDVPEDTHIYISKQDATTKKELPGAHLELYKDGVLFDKWISTDTAHIITNPEDGIYILKEMTAPKGYEVAESITFEVTNGKTSPNPIIMYDEVKVSTPSDATPSDATPSDATPSKPINGGYSGGGSSSTNKTTTGTTIITVKDPAPEIPETTSTPDPVERKVPKTGDIAGTFQSIFGVLSILGTGIFLISKRRNKKA